MQTLVKWGEIDTISVSQFHMNFHLSFKHRKKMIVTALNHLRTKILFRVLSLFVQSTCVCPWSRVLHQRIIYLICVSHWRLKEYHFCLQKTEIGIVWYIPMSPVHFKTGDQTQIVLGQVRSRNNKTSNPRLFSYNLVGLWLWENLMLKKKKKRWSGVESNIQFSLMILQKWILKSRFCYNLF